MLSEKWSFPPSPDVELPFRVQAFTSLMSVLVGFAISYLVWGLVSLVQFDRVLDAGSMIFYPGLLALFLWLVLLLPLAVKLGADHKIFQLEGSILRGGGTTLGLYLLLLVGLQTGVVGDFRPFQMFELIPSIAIMFLVVAFLLGAISLPLHIIFSRFLQAAFQESEASPAHTQLGSVRKKLAQLLEHSPDDPEQWRRAVIQIQELLNGQVPESLNEKTSPEARSQMEEEPSHKKAQQEESEGEEIAESGASSASGSPPSDR